MEKLPILKVSAHTQAYLKKTSCKAMKNFVDGCMHTMKTVKV